MNRSISPRVYTLLLLAYPAEFRREYGSQMTQVFRDSCRDQARQTGKIGLLTLWLLTLVDLIQTAPHEHFENFGKENSVMNNLRRDALAVLGCLAIIVIAFFAHSGLRNGTFYLPLLGYILDAIVVTGVIGNLVVFLLVKATKRNPLRIALWTFVIIHGLGLALSFLLGMQVEPQFNFGGVILGYVASFLFWFGLHWIWAHRNRGQVTA